MATREHLATTKAQAVQRIEAALPETVTSTWPTKAADREVAMMDYLAGVFERSSSTKKAQDKMTDAEKVKAEQAAADKKAAREAEKQAQHDAEHGEDNDDSDATTGAKRVKDAAAAEADKVENEEK